MVKFSCCTVTLMISYWQAVFDATILQTVRARTIQVMEGGEDTRVTWYCVPCKSCLTKLFYP